jgi:glycosyltransferase involved in cell wall biosynthesis
MNRIIIDCERMKHPHTGLYHFCRHLGESLLELNDAATEFSFFIPPSEKNCFGTKANYITQSSLHKFLLPSTRNFDLWHATHQATAYLPSHRNIKIVLTIHDLNFLHDESKDKRKKLRYLDDVRKKAARADHIVAISEFTRKEISEHLDVPAGKTSVIYNGCNIRDIGEIQRPKSSPAKPFLFTIGTIVEKKNFHVLPSLLTGNDMQLLIAGITQKEDYKQRIIAEGKKWEVEDRIIFTGAISENDKQWYMKNCRAFLFPSISEGFGLPVVEAMHFGKPCILSNSTSLPEIGGSEAYYFKSFDPGEMRNTLDEALNDYDQRNPADSIRKRSELFSWKNAAKEYLEIYKKVAAKD